MGRLNAFFNKVFRKTPDANSSSSKEEKPVQGIFDEEDTQFFESLFDEGPAELGSPPDQATEEIPSLKEDANTSGLPSVSDVVPSNSSSLGAGEEQLTEPDSSGGAGGSQEVVTPGDAGGSQEATTLQGVTESGPSLSPENGQENAEPNPKIAELEAEVQTQKSLVRQQAKEIKELQNELKKVNRELESQKKKTINLLQVAFGKKGEKLKSLSSKHRTAFFSALGELSFTSEQVWGISNNGKPGNTDGDSTKASDAEEKKDETEQEKKKGEEKGEVGKEKKDTEEKEEKGKGKKDTEEKGEEKKEKKDAEEKGEKGKEKKDAEEKGEEGKEKKNGEVKKKGNPNLGRKPKSLWNYSSHMAYDINAFNLTEEDVLDIHAPADLQEKFQKAKEEAQAEADAKGLTGQERVSFFLFYLTSRFDIFPTIHYFPGFYYTTLNVSPIAKGCGATVNAAHTNRPLKASAVTPEVLAHFAYEKYRNGLPVNRLCDMAEAEDGIFSRSTVSNWLIEAYNNYLWLPHYALLYFQKLRKILLGDETYCYSRENGLMLSTCYLWALRTSPLDTIGPQIVSFWFDKNRIKLIPEFYLCDYDGKLQTDGYAAYVDMRLKNGKIVKAGCWVHARRPVIVALPLGVNEDELTSGDWVNLWSVQAAIIMSEIFHRESELKDLSPEARLEERQLRIAPLVAFLYKLCDLVKKSPDFDSNGEEGAAVNYILSRKRELSEFLKDGALQLSTNDLERCNIIVALVRKRAKIFDSIDGAAAAGGYFSLIETAEENGVNGEVYLTYLLTVMPQIMKDHKGEIEEFRAWLEKAKERLEEARKKHFEKPRDQVKINWEGLGDPPSLQFMEKAMPWLDSFKDFAQARQERRDKLIKSVLDTITMQNLQDSPISAKGIEMILEADMKGENRLEGLKMVFEEMKNHGEFTEESQARYFHGPIKNVSLETGSIFTLLKENNPPEAGMALETESFSGGVLESEGMPSGSPLPDSGGDPGTRRRGFSFTFTDDATMEKEFECIDFRYLFPEWEDLPERMSLEDAMKRVFPEGEGGGETKEVGDEKPLLGKTPDQEDASG